MWCCMLRKLGAVTAGFIAATLAIELALCGILATPLKWLLPVPSAPFLQVDPNTRTQHRPNVSGMWVTEHRAFIRNSNLGLRDRNREIAHDQSPRAIVIGDSFVEAKEVEWQQTGVAVAERLLARDIPGAEAVNLGQMGALPALDIALLQFKGLPLTPNVAVVTVQVETLLDPRIVDDSVLPGYRRGADGAFHVSFGFRKTLHFRLLAGIEGNLFYWLLDHSQIARVLDTRQAVGWLAELWSPPDRAGGTAWACSPNALDAQTELWIDGQPSVARAVLDAFIRDLSTIRRDNRLPIILGTLGIEARCPALAPKRAALTNAIRAKLAAAGLQFADLDAAVVSKVGRDRVSWLYGFGSHLGGGHFNVEGNRVFGEVLADVLRPALGAL